MKITVKTITETFHRCSDSVRYIALFCVAMLTSYAHKPLCAQQVSDTIRSEIKLKNVDVFGKRRANPLSVAVPEQVADRVYLEKIGIADLADALKQFAGVTVRDYGGVGGLKTISVRGLDPTMTSVAVDGMAMGSIGSGQVDVGGILLHDLDQISLRSGSVANLQMPARMAMSAASVLLTSRQPLFTTAPYIFKASLRGGSYGLFNPAIYTAARLTEQQSLAVSASLERADGNYPFDVVTGPKTVEHRTRLNSQTMRLIGHADYFLTLSEWSKVHLQTHYLYSDRGLPGGVIYYNEYSKEHLWDQEFRVQGEWNRVFDASAWEMNLRGKYNHHYTHYRDISKKYPNGQIDDKYWENEYYVSINANNVQADEPLRYAASADYWCNTLTNNFPSETSPVRHTLASHLQARYEQPKWTASVGLLVLATKETVENGEMAKNRFAPTGEASLIWKPWDEHYLRLRTSWKQIYRLPTFNELYYDRIGNVRLRPERGHQFDLGITYQVAVADWFPNLSVSGDVYAYFVRDKIVAVPSLFVWRMSNRDRVNILGADLSADAQFKLAKNYQLMLKGHYSYQRAIDLSLPDEPHLYKSQIPYIPFHSGSLSAMLVTPYATLSYNLMASGVRYTSIENKKANEVEAFRDHSVSLTVPLRIARHECSLQGTIKNLENKNYEIIRFYPMPGRTYELKLTYSLN